MLLSRNTCRQVFPKLQEITANEEPQMLIGVWIPKLCVTPLRHTGLGTTMRKGWVGLRSKQLQGFYRSQERNNRHCVVWNDELFGEKP